MLKCSFIEGPILHRLKYGKGRGQNLAKAVGMKSNKNRNIIDATAGLGYDAFILASLGANVTLIERSEKIFEINKISKNKNIVNYCGGGIAASLEAFVLYQLGFKNIAIYDNSLHEWAAIDQTLPMEND